MSSQRGPWTRRDFVRASSLAALSATVPAKLIRGQRAALLPNKSAIPFTLEQRGDQDTVRALAMRAIDAAKEAGATYAEARITRIVSQSYSGPGLLLDGEDLGIGVRAFVNGAWGFAASPYLQLDEAAQLARDAVAQATFNAEVSSHELDFGKYPAVSGSWTTPIRIDPLQIPIAEKTDFVRSLSGLFPSRAQTRMRGLEISGGLGNMGFSRQERAVATTEGSYFTQTLYTSGGLFSVAIQEVNWDGKPQRRSNVVGRGISAAGAGWERILDANLREQIPQLIEEAESLLFVPHKPVDIGRYTIVCDAATTAAFIRGALGEATQIDRALGYEANARGTSYLGPDPLTHLGTSIASPLLTLHGDRSAPLGLATVKWDEEGVAPEEFTLVKDGVLIDYQTTREQSAWLSPWYQRQNIPIRSHGCAACTSALTTPLQFCPNLTMAPGKDDVGFMDLVKSTKRGIAVTGGYANMDFQSRTGMGEGNFREIVDGKLGAFIDGAAYMFDSPQLLKTFQAIGGASSQEMVPSADRKGQPAQAVPCSVTAVPAIVKDMAIIDPVRRA